MYNPASLKVNQFLFSVLTGYASIIDFAVRFTTKFG